jgi:O-antigen chain-terminating methyltransferase
MADEIRETLAETLERLKRERDEADRRYNDALTALDRSLRPPVDVPEPLLPLDDRQVTPLNEAWNVLPSAPSLGGGVKGRLGGFVWRIVAPYLQRQLTFNSLLVDHVNRNAAAARAAHQAAEATARALRDQFAAQADVQARLMALLQQVTGYVDTKDRDTGGGALVVNAGLSALAENQAKRWESFGARERRFDARTAALAATHEELRTLVGVSQQGLLTLKREVERLIAAPAAARPRDDAGAPLAGGPAAEAFAPALDAYKYVGFEDQFRGSREAIRERLSSYLPFFDGRTDVLDVGCGRGEFLDLLAGRGIPARGIDLNHEMAEVCRARGLDVAEADAVGYLAALPDASLGGLFAAQVVEHLEPGYLLRFLELAFHKLRPGGRIVLETLNPACWVAFFESYIRDITHAWPLHPETLAYLMTASGFTRVDIEFRSPVPEQDRLHPVALPAGADAALVDLAEAFNGNVEKLNARMFTFMDYAAVGEKGGEA